MVKRIYLSVLKFHCRLVVLVVLQTFLIIAQNLACTIIALISLIITAILYTASRLPTINMGRPFFWHHLPVPAWTIDLELRAAGNSAGSLTPPSCTPQNHSVSLITRCLNLPHVTSQCNVARDWVRYAPFCFCCDSRGRKWGPQHHRFITGPPTPQTKRQNGGLLSYIARQCVARWYISSAIMIRYRNTSGMYSSKNLG